MGRYAMVYSETASSPQTVTQTPIKLRQLSPYTLEDGVEAQATFDLLRVRVPGAYLISADIGLTVDSADNFYISIYKNGLATGYRSGEYVDTLGLGNISIHGILELNQNDVVELYINSGADDTYAVTIGSSQFSMVAI
jgi:hypothetical protein